MPADSDDGRTHDVTRNTLLKPDPVGVRLRRLVSGVLTGQVNPLEVARLWLVKWRIRRRLRIIDDSGLLKAEDPAYRDYIETQLGHVRSVRSLFPDVSWKHEIVLPRVRRFYDERGLATADASVLCVGCRTGSELDAFERLGFGTVKGIDLYSLDPERIELMDMHRMRYPDNSFDVVYSADSLEHSYDLERALGEIIRVAKPAALLCVLTPMDFDVNARHPSDIKSLDNLYRLLGPAFYRAHHAEVRQTRKAVHYGVAICEIRKNAPDETPDTPLD